MPTLHLIMATAPPQTQIAQSQSACACLSATAECAQACGASPAFQNSFALGRYEARGLFLDPPTAGLTRGRWQLRMPDGPLPNVPASELAFDSADDLFDGSRCHPAQ